MKLRHVLMLLTLAGAGLGIVGMALAAIPSSSGVISSCYEKKAGALRVIDAQAGAVCKSTELALAWNQVGPAGLKAPQARQDHAGPSGPAGPKGPSGPAGGTGPAGPAGQDSGPLFFTGATGTATPAGQSVIPRLDVPAGVYHMVTTMIATNNYEPRATYPWCVV